MRTSVGFFMSRANRVYDKQPLSLDGMIELMESRGLLIPDKDRARHYLKYINYYRLSGYGYLLEDEHTDGRRSHHYPNGASFDDLLKLYIFDRRLRLLTLDAVERIEVGIRTVIASEMSRKYNNGYWYMDAALFDERVGFSHAEFIGKVKGDTAKNSKQDSDRNVGREPFITHYYNNYNDPELPPIWMLIEVMSLGTWSKVYSNLRISKDRKTIARVLDLPPTTLKSWLHSLNYLRNLCAHHSRIYGRKLAFPPAMRDGWPELPPFAFSRFIAVVEYLLKSVSPDTDWKMRVKALIDSEPLVNPELLGIKDQSFWEHEL